MPATYARTVLATILPDAKRAAEIAVYTNQIACKFSSCKKQKINCLSKPNEGTLAGYLKNNNNYSACGRSLAKTLWHQIRMQALQGLFAIAVYISQAFATFLRNLETATCLRRDDMTLFPKESCHVGFKRRLGVTGNSI